MFTNSSGIVRGFYGVPTACSYGIASAQRATIGVAKQVNNATNEWHERKG